MDTQSLEEAWDIVMHNPEIAKVCSNLVEATYREGSISHYSTARILNRAAEPLAIALLNTAWDGTIAKDNGIAINFKVMHTLLLEVSPVYRAFDRLAKVGILSYKNSELNKQFNYLEKPVVQLKRNTIN